MASSEETDLVQWGFNTLVQSYDEYHTEGKNGKESRPLRDFASQMPRSEPPKPAARPAAKKSLFVAGLGGGSRSSKAKETKSEASNAAPRGDSSDQEASASGAPAYKSAERSKPKAAARMQPSAAERGPVPPPMGTSDPWQMGASDPWQHRPNDSADGAEAAAEGPQSPEDYATWIEYYRQCAEYYKQAEASMAEQGGIEMPAAPSSSASRSVRATPPAAAASSTSTFPSAGQASPAQPQQSLPQPQSHQIGAAGVSELQSALLAGLLPQATAAGLAGNPALQAQLGALNGNAAAYSSLLPQSPYLAGGLLGVGAAAPTLGVAQGALGPQLPGLASLPGLPAQSLAGLPAGLLGVGNTAAAGARTLGGIDDEALANLLMAWYYSGYYTGHFAARQGR